MDANDIGSDLREKAKECKSPAEVLSLANAEGYRLTEEELEAISGGSWNSSCHTYMCFSHE